MTGQAPLIGAICDDLTGATDIASMFVRGGMSVVQHVGLPLEGAALPNAEVLVIALKSRSIPAAEAVGQSLAACRHLRTRGVRQIYFKYCSTFDSTPAGNIGPVAEAMREELGAQIVPHLPSLPVNGRTVYQGHLFVHDRPLNETGMARHPLNPMTDADLVRVLRAQTEAPVGFVAHRVVAEGASSLAAALAKAAIGGVRHVIGDAISDGDLAMWAAALPDAPLVAGGSGLAVPLACIHLAAEPPAASSSAGWPVGPALILAGSCSAMTLDQIEDYRVRGNPCLHLDVQRIMAGGPVAEDAVRWIAEQEGAPLVYSSAHLDEIDASRTDVAEAIEHTLGQIAGDAVTTGRAQRLVVAGGETSGAVVRALGASALRIGPEIAPGVPWTEVTNASGAPICALALKSGNFGGPDFFTRALAPGPPQ